jgi:hypothetical protein
VQETLGGNYADSYGRGLSSITVAGHNGWKGGLLASGEDLFYQLRDTCFVAWHEKRDEARKVGRDPNSVRLTFVDTLDDLDCLVAPRPSSSAAARARPCSCAIRSSSWCWTTPPQAPACSTRS